MAHDMIQTESILEDASYLAHRYDEKSKAFQFVHLNRDDHRNSTFLTDEYIPETAERFMVSAGQSATTNIRDTSVHFIFHSAFCCSTMLARAMDVEGHAMGLKEPIVLNDIVRMKRAGEPAESINMILDQALSLLARPFADGESVIIKPSNIVNCLAEEMLSMRPGARALLLHAPLKSYLRSLSAKNMWGKIWARDTTIGIMNEGNLIGGFASADLLRLTDMQMAAVGWLSSHAMFVQLTNKFGPERVQTLNSQKFLDNKGDTIMWLSDFFDLRLDRGRISEIVEGPAFTQHSKNFGDFDSNARRTEQTKTDEAHGEEIEMVVKWATAVADSQGLPMVLQSGLLE